MSTESKRFALMVGVVTVCSVIFSVIVGLCYEYGWSPLVAVVAFVVVFGAGQLTDEYLRRRYL